VDAGTLKARSPPAFVGTTTQNSVAAPADRSVAEWPMGSRLMETASVL
jgi:hypothetical protein